MTTILFTGSAQARLDPLVRAQKLLQDAMLPRLRARLVAAGARLAEWDYPESDTITAGYWLLPGQALPDAAPVKVCYVAQTGRQRHRWDHLRPMADDARQAEAVTALAGLLQREGWRVVLLTEPPTASYYCPCVLVYEAPKVEGKEGA